MANRYIPFGYEIRDGVICIVERETEVVQSVYALYIQGMSLLAQPAEQFGINATAVLIADTQEKPFYDNAPCLCG